MQTQVMHQLSCFYMIKATGDRTPSDADVSINRSLSSYSSET